MKYTKSSDLLSSWWNRSWPQQCFWQSKSTQFLIYCWLSMIKPQPGTEETANDRQRRPHREGDTSVQWRRVLISHYLLQQILGSLHLMVSLASILQEEWKERRRLSARGLWALAEAALVTCAPISFSGLSHMTILNRGLKTQACLTRDNMF